MKDIVFKAKTIDNDKWVYGTYIKLCNRSYILSNACFNYQGSEIYEVKFETLCQYTGIRDINNNKIYENDLILYNQLQSPYIVKWNKEQAKYELQTQEGYAQLGFNQATMNNIGVVGNYFDDLLTI